MGSAAVRTEQYADAERFAGSGFAFFEPGTLYAERFSSRNAFDFESDAIHLGGFEGIDEEAREDILHRKCDRQAIGREGVARGKRVFDLYWSMAMQPNLAGEVERGAFAVQRILRESAEGGERNKERRKLRVIDQLDMEGLLLRRLGARDQQGQIQRYHPWCGAQFSRNRSEMVASDSADGAADIHDLRGSQIGRKRGDHAASRHGNLDVTEAQKRMAAEIDAIAPHRRDGTSGIDGNIALNEDHPGHVSGGEMPIIGTRRCCAALCCNETVALKLTCELLKRGRLEAGKDERRFDGRERGAGRKAGP